VHTHTCLIFNLLTSHALVCLFVLQATGNELLVFVYDPSDQGAQPNGKQRISAISSPGGDTYTPSSGIWQTVWLESVPSNYISTLRINQASLATVELTVTMSGASGPVTFTVMDASGTKVATAQGTAGTATSIAIPNPKLWDCDNPNLYDVEISAGVPPNPTQRTHIRTNCLPSFPY
jgi:beta-galactosidase/beta-glucuronidase